MKFSIRSLLAAVLAIAVIVYCMSFPTELAAYVVQALGFGLLCVMLTVGIAWGGEYRIAAVTYCAVFASYWLCGNGVMAGVDRDQGLPFFPESLLRAAGEAIFETAPLPTRSVHLGDPFGNIDIAVGGGQSLASPYSVETFCAIGSLFIQMIIAGICSYAAREIYKASRKANSFNAELNETDETASG